MTDLQIKYQQLQLERNRVQEELELNRRAVSETERHNMATEQAARDQLAVSWHQAHTARQNADTNRLNYGVNLMNAETNRLNYGVNAMNAQTNARNAAVNERNAAVNERNAAINEYNAYTNRLNYGVNLTRANAEIDYLKEQTADVASKNAARYWEATTQRERASALNYATSGIASGVKSAANAAVNAIPRSGTNVNLGGKSGGSFGSTSKTGTNAAKLLTGATSSIAYMYDIYPLDKFGIQTGIPSVLQDFQLFNKTGKHYWELTLDEGRQYFGSSWKTLGPTEMEELKHLQTILSVSDQKKRKRQTK